jgi:8-oxo-dGTP pyrophosphatase MutT (NUDIX family)
MNKSNPWKTLDSKIIYSNPWIRVREDSVLKPNGSPGIYGVVETRIATGVVALTNNNDIVLVGQYRYAMDEYSWEIIEGGAELDEDPMKAAKRELQEEAGLIASEFSLLGPEIHLSNCHSSERGLLYFAKELTETEKSPDDTEILEIITVPFREALDMVEKGEIKDSLSIIGIYRAARLLNIL